MALKTKSTVMDAETRAARERFIDLFSAAFRKRASVFTLNAPVSVVVKNGKGYRRESMIGGEGFKFKTCYLGKTGKHIWVFTPAEAADFETAEFTEEQAKDLLMGFSQVFEATSTDEAIKEALAERNAEKEAANNIDKAKIYGKLEWGTW